MEGEHRKNKPHTSNSDLMSSAKVLAEAAKSAFSHESDKINKTQVAGAVADVLGAAKHYGKLEEKSFGKYVDKAETYLHKYSSTTTNTMHATTGSNGGHDGGEGKHGHASSGGYGEYVKIAQGLLNKKQEGHNGHSTSSSGGGANDYIKLAQDLLKKH